MVNYKEPQLDLVFAALSDSTRRRVLDQLGAGNGLTVSELAQPHGMSLPGFMKHLAVLEAAGLIARSKEGRVVRCELDAAPMQEAARGWPATNASGTASSTRSAAISTTKRKSRHGQHPTARRHPRSPRPTHPQLPRRARKSLARVDRPASADPLVRPAAGPTPPRGRDRPARGRALPRRLHHGRRRAAEVSGSTWKCCPSRRLVFTWAWGARPRRSRASASS